MTELDTFLEDVRTDLYRLNHLTTYSDQAWMFAALDVADYVPTLLNLVETVLIHLDIADTAAEDQYHPYQSIRRAINLAFEESREQ